MIIKGRKPENHGEPLPELPERSPAVTPRGTPSRGVLPQTLYPGVHLIVPLVDQVQLLPLRSAYEHHHNMAETARALGLERSHLYKKCAQLGIGRVRQT